jgi:hypothetical protein
MTVGQILRNAAAMLNIEQTEMILEEEHLGIRAMNNARKRVELVRDFETQKAMVRLSVGVSGTNLSSAVLESDGTTAADVKTVHMAYLRDASTSPVTYFPLYLDTKKTLATRAREIGDRWTFDEYDIRYRDDNEIIINSDRLQMYQLGRTMYLNPQQDEAKSCALDCSLWMSDYDWNYVDVVNATTVSSSVQLLTAGPTNFVIGTTLLGQLVTTIAGTTVTLAGNANANVSGQRTRFTQPRVNIQGGTAAAVREEYTDWFTTAAHEYLMWSVVCELNHRFAAFVPRTDGYVAPPEKLRDQALQALLAWDDGMIETSIQGIR